ncbi:MAG: double zinc ribbon domain-containing protein [Capsulimonadaceae bacterium]
MTAMIWTSARPAGFFNTWLFPLMPGEGNPMRCTSCGREGSSRQAYCSGCGAKLAVVPVPTRVYCRHCRSHRPAGQKICRVCGQARTTPALAAASAVAAILFVAGISIGLDYLVGPASRQSDMPLVGTVVGFGCAVVGLIAGVASRPR